MGEQFSSTLCMLYHLYCNSTPKLTYLFLSILAVFDWKINQNSCRKAELQVVVGLALYELSRERSKTD